MSKAEKKINKWLIGAIIGTTLLGVGGFSMTPKGQSFRRRLFKKCKRIGTRLGRLLFASQQKRKGKKKKRRNRYEDDEW